MPYPVASTIELKAIEPTMTNHNDGSAWYSDLKAM